MPNTQRQRPKQSSEPVSSRQRRSKLHEVAKAAAVAVESVLHEGGILGRKPPARRRVVARQLQQNHEQERARVVVRAVAVGVAGHGIGRMLKDADRIGQPLHMIQRELGELDGLLSQGLHREPRAMMMPVVAARLAERCEIMMGRLAPDHPAA